LGVSPPAVGAACGIYGRCDNDVAAIPSNIEARSKLPGGGLHLATGMGEEEMPTAARGDLLRGFGKRAFTRHKSSQRGLAVYLGLILVDIEDEAAGHFACRDSDHGVGPSSPPAPDHTG